MKSFYFNLIVSVLLIVGGFLVPPVGIIDGSVLTAVGLLLMFSVIERIQIQSRQANLSRYRRVTALWR